MLTTFKPQQRLPEATVLQGAGLHGAQWDEAVLGPGLGPSSEPHPHNQNCPSLIPVLLSQGGKIEHTALGHVLEVWHYWVGLGPGQSPLTGSEVTVTLS